MYNSTIKMIGSAFGLGAKIYSTDQGPNYLKNFINNNSLLSLQLAWGEIVGTDYAFESFDENGHNFISVRDHNLHLSKVVSDVVEKNMFPVIIGGDHCCGIGTWSGVTNALHAEENFGLIWIDAHMDAHTYETSPSKSYHGMPLAVLLGEGNEALVSIGKSGRKIKPEHLVLIGIRSYEDGEYNLLKRQGVKIYFIEDVKARGIDAILEEALDLVTKNTMGFGVSIDMDAFDPEQAPGVGSPEVGGLDFETTCEALPILLNSPYLKALEITEFNPTLDLNDKTVKLIERLLYRLHDSMLYRINSF